MRKHHDLKIRKEYFDQVLIGKKTFEIRFNDRDFQESDFITLREWEPEIEYTGRKVDCIIGYKTAYAQKENWVVFSLIKQEPQSQEK